MKNNGRPFGKCKLNTFGRAAAKKVGRRSRQRDFTRNPFELDQLEPRILLSATPAENVQIEALAVDSMQTGLTGLKNLVDLSTGEDFRPGQELTAFEDGLSMDDLLDFDGNFASDFVNRLTEFLDPEDEEPKSGGDLIAFLEGLSREDAESSFKVAVAEGLYDDDTDELSFDVTVSASQLSNLLLKTGSGLSAYGVSAGEGDTIELETSAELRFTFQFKNLSSPGDGSDFFVTVNSFEYGLKSLDSVFAQSFVVDTLSGGLQASGSIGTLEMLEGNIGFIVGGDADGDGRLSISELQALTVFDLEESETSQLQVRFDVEDLGDTSVLGFVNPTIRLSSDSLFGADEPSLEFDVSIAGEVEARIREAVVALEGMALGADASSSSQRQLPFLQQALSGLLGTVGGLSEFFSFRQPAEDFLDNGATVFSLENLLDNWVEDFGTTAPGLGATNRPAVSTDIHYGDQVFSIEFAQSHQYSTARPVDWAPVKDNLGATVEGLDEMVHADLDFQVNTGFRLEFDLSQGVLGAEQVTITAFGFEVLADINADFDLEFVLGGLEVAVTGGNLGGLLSFTALLPDLDGDGKTTLAELLSAGASFAFGGDLVMTLPFAPVDGGYDVTEGGTRSPVFVISYTDVLNGVVPDTSASTDLDAVILNLAAQPGDGSFGAVLAAAEAMRGLVPALNNLSDMRLDFWGTDLQLRDLFKENGAGGLAEFFNVGPHIEAYLAAERFRAENWNAGDPLPTLPELIDFLNLNWLNALPGDGNLLSWTRTAAGFTIFFASQNNTFNRAAKLQSMYGLLEGGFLLEADLEVMQTTDIAFRLDLDLVEGAHTFTLDQFEVSAEVDATGVVGSGQVAGLEVSVGRADGETASGSISFAASGSYANGHFSLTPSGEIDLELPIYATFDGKDLTSGVVPRMFVTGDMFPPQDVSVTTQGLEEALGGFLNFSAGDIAQRLQDLRNWLNRFSGLEHLQTAIPFLDRDLSDVFSFGEAFHQAISSALNFSSVRSLNDFVAAFETSGLLRSGQQVTYNELEETFAIPLRFVFDAPALEGLELDFGLDFGDGALADLQTSARADLDLSLEGRLDLIINLNDASSSSGISWAVRDARMTGRAGFIIDDLEASARLGFMNITAGEGSRVVVDTEFTSVLDADGDLSTSNDRTFLLSALLGTGLDNKYTFSFEGTAKAELRGLDVAGGFGNLNIGSDKQVVVQIPDLTDLNSVQVSVSDLSSQFNFKDLNFDILTEALKRGVELLEDSLKETEFYQTRIPGLNVSIEEIFPFVRQLTTDLEGAFASNTGAAIQEVEGIIRNTLGLSEEAFSLSLSGSVLDLSLNWGAALQQYVAFNLDVEAIKAMTGESDSFALNRFRMLSDLLNPGAGGQIYLEALAELVLEAGIDLATVGQPGGPDVFLYDYDAATDTGTNLRIDLQIHGKDLELGFKVGSLDIGVEGGSLALDGDGNPDTNDFARFRLFLQQQDESEMPDDGRFYLGQESLSNNLDWDLSGAFDLNLPIMIGIGGNSMPLSNFRFRTAPSAGDEGLAELVARLASGELFSASGPLQFEFPNFEQAVDQLARQFSLFGMLNNPKILVDGLNMSLSALESIFMSETAENLPFIGNKLRHAGNEIARFRVDTVGGIAKALGLEEQPIALLRQTLWDVLGERLGIIKDSNSDGLVTIDDIKIGWYDAAGQFIDYWQPYTVVPAGADSIQFDIRLGRSLAQLGVDLPLDFNIPGLGLNFDGGFGLEAEWAFDFGFGLSLNDGFYLSTFKEGTAQAEIPEFRFDAYAFLDGSPQNPNVRTPFTGEGKLLFFKATATDKQPNFGTSAQPDKDNSGVRANLGFDLAGDERGRLSLDRLLSQGLTNVIRPTSSVDAKLDLGLSLELDGFEGLPKLFADLVVDWSLSGPRPAGMSQAAWEASRQPQISLDNLAVDIGSLLRDFILPITQRVEKIISPLKPVLDTLTAEIPGLSLLGMDASEANFMGVLNLIRSANGLDPINWGFVWEAKRALELVGQVTAMVNYDGRIELGSIEGFGADNVTWTQAPGHGMDPAFEQALRDLEKDPNANYPDPANREGFQFLKYITDIANWAKLLTGRDATLFSYELPLLDFNWNFEDLTLIRFLAGPVPIDVSLFGGVRLLGDLKFGYDTFGIRRAMETGNPVHALDGFFVFDHDKNNQPKPEIIFNANLGLQGRAGGKMLGGGAAGEIKLEVFVDLNDPNDDGKVRASEMATLLAYQTPGDEGQVNELFGIDVSAVASLLNLVNIDALVTARAFLFAEAEFFSILSARWEQEIIPPTELWSWSHQGPSIEPVLGRVESGVLYVHSGPRAADRLYFDTEDGGEHFVFTGSGGQVTVQFGEYTQTFSGVTKVVAEGGEGDDIFDASGLMNVAVDFSGGSGNDTLIAGTRSGSILRAGTGNNLLDGSRSFGITLVGGPGDDRLLGGINGDIIISGGGDNFISTGGGNNRVTSGSGINQIQGGAGNNTYVFTKGYNNDIFHDPQGIVTLDFSAIDSDMVIDINRVNMAFITDDGILNTGTADVRNIITGSGSIELRTSDLEGPVGSGAVSESIANSIRELAAYYKNLQDDFMARAGDLLNRKVEGTNLTVDQLLQVSNYLALGEVLDTYVDTADSIDLGSMVRYLQDNWISTLYGGGHGIAAFFWLCAPRGQAYRVHLEFSGSRILPAASAA